MTTTTPTRAAYPLTPAPAAPPIQTAAERLRIAATAARFAAETLALVRPPATWHDAAMTMRGLREAAADLEAYAESEETR